MSDIPLDHPRYKSLEARHKLEQGLVSGMTTPTGLISHGRGEAFDYLLGERTHTFADAAARAGAALLVLAKLPVLSVNGNTAALVRDEMVALARALECPIEINLFHDAPERRALITHHFRELGFDVLGTAPDALLPGLASARARVDSRGMLQSDVVLVSLEDGDRTEALVRAGKQVVAIDLNPLSRTPQTATVSITDNVQRALPHLTRYVLELQKQPQPALRKIISEFDNQNALANAVGVLRGAVGTAGAAEEQP